MKLILLTASRIKNEQIVTKRKREIKMIEICNLNKYYKSKGNTLHVLKDINISIADKERVAILGKSGAGKSTLLHIMGLLNNFDSGAYKIDGTSVSDLKDTQLAKLRNEKIGFIMQDFSLLDHKKVIENVMLPLYFNKDCKYSEMQEKALKALDMVGLKDQSNKKANQLSGGQRQRISIARAFVTNPEIILADEPTGALDAETRDDIMKLLVQLNQDNGTTLVVITHDEHVADYCGRKLYIRDGKISENNAD